MNVRKFIATNARDALRKVKETLGADAIILSNRAVPGGVEIMAVAARDMAMIVPTPVAAEVPVPSPQHRRHELPIAEEIETDDYRVRLSAARANLQQPFGNAATHQAASMVPPAAKVAAAQKMTSSQQQPMVNAGIPRTGGLRNLERTRPAVSMAQESVAPTREPVPPVREAIVPMANVGAEIASRADVQMAQVVPAEVMDEIRTLRRIVEQHLAGFAWGETARMQPAKAEVLRQMLDAGFSPQFSRELLAELPDDMDASQAMAWIKGAADRSLLTLSNEADIVDRGGVYALVGPTGVGKTTTTAKLAARCVLKHGPSRVALVTTDSYRIGAHEQLRIYGRILGVPVYLVKDAAELRHTLAELQHKHMVLIDTMGMSQKDKLVPELTGMLEGCNVHRLLLLNATSRGDTLDDVIRAYQGPDLAGAVLTKIDEAASLATALDVVMRHGLRLHYVSNGQRVPEDLHLPNRSYLLHRAFKDVPETSPHRFEGVETGLVMANSGLVAAGGRRG